MTAKEIREQIQYQLNQKDQKAQSYIDTVYNIEQIINNALQQAKNINYDTVLPTAVCCNCFCDQPVHKEGSVYCKDHADM